jgi:RNA polymerase sigma factor (TIGR02999 family)
MTISDATRLLEEAYRGDRQAAADLLPLVYDELRKLAAVRMASEKPGQTLNATALVHEAYLRLIGDQQFNGRSHFFAAAAEAMRRILIENARRKQAVKHGGDLQRAAMPDELLVASNQYDDVLAIDEALQKLEGVDAQAAHLVKLHFFAGLTIEESANILGVSERKAYTIWAYARAWLFRALDES